MTDLPTPHGPDTARATPPVCPRHPGRVAYAGCPVCARPMCLECQRPTAAGPVLCADCDAEPDVGARLAAGTSSAGASSGAVPSAVGDDVAAPSGGVLASLRRTPVTSALLALTAVVYVLQWLTRSADVGLTELLWYAGAYTSRLGMEPWRMLTYALVHDVSGPTHVALNLLALWAIGRGLEPALGWWRLLALYVLSAVGGAVFALWTTDPLQPVVGASGAVYGLFAALFVLTRRIGGEVRSVAVVIALNLAFSFLMPGISWQVHVGGLLTGAVVAAVYAWGAPLGAPRARAADVARGSGGRRLTDGAHAAGLVAVLAALAVLTGLGAARIGLDALVG